MRIVGIDPGLETTGYGVIDADDRAIRLHEAGIIKSSSRRPLTRRLLGIRTAVTQLLRETRPAVVVLEELYAHYDHPKTAILMGHARGVICLAAAELKIPVQGYLPTRVKKAIVGNGLAGKRQVQRMVTSLLQLRTTPEPLDVTDALALAIAHAHMLGHHHNGHLG